MKRNSASLDDSTTASCKYTRRDSSLDAVLHGSRANSPASVIIDEAPTPSDDDDCSLFASIRTLAATDSCCFPLSSDEHLRLLIAAHNRLGEAIARAKAAHDAAEVVVLPTDTLLHTFSYLPAVALAVAAQVCRHFDRTARQRVQLHIEQRVGARQMKIQRWTSGVLHVFEGQMASFPTLLSKLTPSMVDNKYDASFDAQDVLDRLKTIHRAIIRAHMQLICQKIDEVRLQPGPNPNCPELVSPHLARFASLRFAGSKSDPICALVTV